MGPSDYEAHVEEWVAAVKDRATLHEEGLRTAAALACHQLGEWAARDQEARPHWSPFLAAVRVQEAGLGSPEAERRMSELVHHLRDLEMAQATKFQWAVTQAVVLHRHAHLHWEHRRATFRMLAIEGRRHHLDYFQGDPPRVDVDRAERSAATLTAGTKGAQLKKAAAAKWWPGLAELLGPELLAPQSSSLGA